MKRSPIELERLYGLGPGASDPAIPSAGARVGVLEVLLPAGWVQLAPAWRGVQTDLELPAPAIAVSGVDGLQLWFSFAAPIPVPAGTRFLQALRERYLPEVAAARVRIFCGAAECPARPPVEVGAQRWSAFITNDLASVFAETPWLDIPPSDEGQASLLRALEPIRPAAFEAALQTLVAVDTGPPVPRLAMPPALSTEAPDSAPARFLAGVMNDPTAPLALRIEAARVLLRHARAG